MVNYGEGVLYLFLLTAHLKEIVACHRTPIVKFGYLQVKIPPTSGWGGIWDLLLGDKGASGGLFNWFHHG